AHERTGDWILAQLRARADTVGVQAITHVTRRGDVLHLRNFLARFRPALPERVLFLAHWDTRPHADQSANLGAQRLPVPGANDGASGVAVLLGVAGALKVKPPAVGVDLLFVDGEDYGGFADSSDVLIGSRYFAAIQPAGYLPIYASTGNDSLCTHFSYPRCVSPLSALCARLTTVGAPWTTAAPRCSSACSRSRAPACAT